MEKVRILVAAHKAGRVYSDSVYRPVHVGRALAAEPIPGALGDDTGENISRQNREYCELTAMYWAWRNLKPTEYIGLAHYRRYLEPVVTAANIDTLMRGHDIMLPRPYLNDHRLSDKLSRTLCMEDHDIFLLTLRRMCPDYERALVGYLNGFRDTPYNMFVTRWEVFDAYCRFLFPLLAECSRLMRPLPYTQSSRRLGYIAEYLLPVFCLHNNLSVRREGVVSFPGERAPRGTEWRQRVKIALLTRIYAGHAPRSAADLLLAAPGLKQDGIMP